MESLLPKNVTVPPAILKSCLLLEGIGESDQIAIVGCALSQEMDMVRHDAEGMKGEVVSRRTALKVV